MQLYAALILTARDLTSTLFTSPSLSSRPNSFSTAILRRPTTTPIIALGLHARSCI